MRSAILVLLLTTSCASTQDAYRYSGATPVPPVYTPAGAGAPAVGQPGSTEARKRLPPSPDKRALPPEARPGIWASDSASKAPQVAARLSEAPDTPKGLTEAPWRQCWNDVQTCLLADPRGVRATEKDYQCLRWRFAIACGAIRSDRGSIGRRDFLTRYGPGHYSPSDFYDATRKPMRKACEGVDHEDAFESLYRHLYARCSQDWLNTP